MYVVEVIPLTRNTHLSSLSYYSAETYERGSIISVPVRKKDVPAIVVSIEPVSTAKTALRAATFSLRKLIPQENITVLPHSIINTAEELAKIIPAHVGNIIYSLLPPDIRSGERPYPYTAPYNNEEDAIPEVLTATRNDRFIAYRSHIRQAFAHRGSVLLVVPNSASVHTAANALTTGIEKRVVTFSSTHTKKQLASSYEAFTDFSAAKLIITTPSFALLDRHDITHIILEEASSPHYKAKTRPYLDTRDVIRRYATITKRALLMGDILPRTEEEALRRDEIYSTFEEHPARLNFSNSFKIAIPPKPVKTKEFSIFTDELNSVISNTITAKGRVFLLSARRGFSPLIICNDCGHILRCEDSGSPFHLYTKTRADGSEERWLYCATSGKRIRALDTCPQCSSWRLREQGIGIQKAAAEARRLFPDANIITFDHTAANTHTKAKQLSERFYKEKGVIMLGTKMALPYVTGGFNTGGLLSLEALRAIPNWRAEEEVLHTLLTLRERSSEHFVIQTRDRTDPLLEHVKRGSIDKFYDEEIGMRQIMSYPPFATLIHLTWQGDKETLQKTEEEIGAVLHHIDMQCYNNPKPSKTPVRHALIKIAHSDWPDNKLIERLRLLPPSIRVEINPDRIL